MGTTEQINYDFLDGVANQLDQIDGYQVLTQEDVAEYLEIPSSTFSGQYSTNVWLDQNNIPAIEGETPAELFIVDNEKGVEQLVEDGDYVAGVAFARIEFRDEKFRNKDEVENILSEWNEKRENQRMPWDLEDKDLEIYENFQ